MTRLFGRFIREEDGQDLIEYALALGIVALGAIGVITSIGTWVFDRFTNVYNALPAA